MLFRSRMFTSRAEFRTLLRQDNADLRLTEMSYRMGLASQERMENVLRKKTSIQEIHTILKNTSAEPDEINNYLITINSTPLTEKQKASKLLLRPDITMTSLIEAIPQLQYLKTQYSKEALEQTEIQVKYERYIEKEKDLVLKMSTLEEAVIPDNFNYDKVAALSNEALQKFKKIKPRTLGQASRISGVNPSDVQILMVYMGR